MVLQKFLVQRTLFSKMKEMSIGSTTVEIFICQNVKYKYDSF